MSIMVLPELKQMHILVYPFYNNAAELYEKEGRKKFELWLNQIVDAGKRTDTAFVIIRQGKRNGDLFEERLKEYLEKHLKNKYIQSFVSTPISSRAITNFLRKRFVIGNDVLVRSYGQHAEQCVRAQGRSIIEKISALMPNTNFKLKEHFGLSIKHNEFILASRLAPYPELKPEHRQKGKRIAYLLKKGILNPVQVAHIIKKGRTFSERVSLMRKAEQGKPIVQKFRRIKK